MDYPIVFHPDTYCVFSEEGSVWLVDKPLRWTSFDVVNKLKFEIRRQTGLKKFKIGHAGTLDPLADGLLVVCLGKATKRIEEIQSLPKTYEGVFVLGATTLSYDLEHPVINPKPYSHLDEAAVREACARLSGPQLQVPPSFSAVKKDGKSAFQYARKGEEVALQPKPVTVYAFEITRFDLPEVAFSIQCSKGTYIRAIARDLGEMLGCGAYLKRLRRVRIGAYSVDDALPLAPYFEASSGSAPPHRKKRFDLP
ncbi:MAG: tRNA pseudouridine(55) synthase TruB [Bacteroidales bacterium]|nr:tRNA pseudouridine(55) synthase TruB [Bacteroidales bacterium]